MTWNQVYWSKVNVIADICVKSLSKLILVWSIFFLPFPNLTQTLFTELLLEKVCSDLKTTFEGQGCSRSPCKKSRKYFLSFWSNLANIILCSIQRMLVGKGCTVTLKEYLGQNSWSSLSQQIADRERFISSLSFDCHIHVCHSKNAYEKTMCYDL